MYVPVIKKKSIFTIPPPSPLEDRWENQRTIHEGAAAAAGAGRTVVHNAGQDGGGGNQLQQQQEDEMMESTVPIDSMGEGGPPEYGESSGRSQQRMQQMMEPRRFPGERIS